MDGDSRFKGDLDPELWLVPPDLHRVEMVDDRVRPIRGERQTSRLAISLPGAITAILLVAALALGATSLRPTASSSEPAAPASAIAPAGSPAGGSPVGSSNLGDAGTGPGGAGAVTKPVLADDPVLEESPAVPEPTKEPAVPEPTKEPMPSPAPKPTPAPLPETKLIELGLKLDGGRVLVDWSPCDVAGFAYAKVVRSFDATVTWPPSGDDVVIAAIEDPAKTAVLDWKATAGATLAYRVVVIAKHVDGAFVACKSPVRSITVPKPTEPPPTGSIDLSLLAKETKVVISWTACSGDFDHYKVVRSKDSTVTWPTGEYDTGIAAVGKDGERVAWDGPLPSGVTVWYRVFCVKSGDAGYVVLAASPVKSITTPVIEPKPTPTVKTLGLTVAPSAAGIVLTWEACACDGFAFYKVLRSSGPNPSYLPWTDGTTVIAVIDSAGVTQLLDSSVGPGTWYYRVQAIGYWNGGKALLGQTPVLSLVRE
jgi:hypothetical protein